MTAASREKRYREYRWWAIAGPGVVIFLCVRGLIADPSDTLLWFIGGSWSLALTSALCSAGLDRIERLQAEARESS